MYTIEFKSLIENRFSPDPCFVLAEKELTFPSSFEDKKLKCGLFYVNEHNRDNYSPYIAVWFSESGKWLFKRQKKLSIQKDAMKAFSEKMLRQLDSLTDIIFLEGLIKSKLKISAIGDICFYWGNKTIVSFDRGGKKEIYASKSNIYNLILDQKFKEEFNLIHKCDPNTHFYEECLQNCLEDFSAHSLMKYSYVGRQYPRFKENPFGLLKIKNYELRFKAYLFVCLNQNMCDIFLYVLNKEYEAIKKKPFEMKINEEPLYPEEALKYAESLRRELSNNHIDLSKKDISKFFDKKKLKQFFVKLENVRPESLKAGDIVLLLRKFYHHVYVYIDETKCVHFSGEIMDWLVPKRRENIKIKIEPKVIIEEFPEDERKSQILRPILPFKTKWQLTEHAEQWESNTDCYGKYSFLFNNCQHFATHLVLNEPFNLEAEITDSEIGKFFINKLKL